MVTVTMPYTARKAVLPSLPPIPAQLLCNSSWAGQTAAEQQHREG